MARIFLSYKREERDRVRAIAAALEAKGHRVWWDPHLDPRDAAYPIQIKREIEASQSCIVAWSKLATESDFIVSEAEMARAQKKLVCVMLDHDCVPPPPFNTMQLINLSDWHGDASHPEWRRLLAAAGNPDGAVLLGRRLTAGPDASKETQSPNKILRFAFGLFKALALGAAIVVFPLALLVAYNAYSDYRYLQSEEGYSYRATFPTWWSLVGHGSDIVKSNFAEVLGRPLISENPESELRDGEQLVQHLNVYAVDERIHWPSRNVRPKFFAFRWGRETFECALETRRFAYDSTDDLYSSQDVRWDRGEPTGSLTQYIFVDFTRGEWSSAIGQAMPSDEDRNGRVWQEIEAGSSEFLCFDVIRVAGSSAQPGSYACRNELDLRTFQRRALSHPQLRLNYLNRANLNPMIDNAGYAVSRDVVGGEAIINVGSCRRIANY
jgi:hypothetical protein